jgi:hypothetical protein
MHEVARYVDTRNLSTISATWATTRPLLRLVASTTVGVSSVSGPV